MIDVVLATCAALPDLIPDERRLLPALAGRGLRAATWVWDDPAADWAGTRCCVIRGTWDYTGRRDAYLAWTERAAAQTRLFNPPAVVRWNTHKGYLDDLAARGVPVLDHVLCPAGAPADLAGLLRRRGWTEFVLKPAVGATAREALRGTDPALGQAHLDRLLATEDMLVQPFAKSVLEDGELSLMYVEGAFSHAVRKRAGPGDWRVQEEFGGSVEAAEPTPEEHAAAERALAAAPTGCLYARVDLVNAPTPQVIELELVEPALYFGWSDGTAETLAAAIEKRIRE